MKKCPVCNSRRYKNNLDKKQYECLKCGFKNRYIKYIIYDEGTQGIKF